MKPITKIQAFSKKDVNVLNSSKKKKVLCEASLTVPVSAASVVGGVNQIPRKKIKVTNVNNLGGSNPFMKGESSSNIITSSAQASENELTNFFLSSTKALDDEMIPCCSKTISSFLKAPTSPSGSTSSGQMKITNFLPIKKLTKKIKFGKPSARIGVKKLKKMSVMMSSVDDTESSVPLSLDTASTSQAHSPSSKLLKKKKRSLKSERKKSRSQKPLLH
jgi:hypothetical protein